MSDNAQHHTADRLSALDDAQLDRMVAEALGLHILVEIDHPLRGTIIKWGYQDETPYIEKTNWSTKANAALGLSENVNYEMEHWDGEFLIHVPAMLSYEEPYYFNSGWQSTFPRAIVIAWLLARQAERQGE